MYRSNLKNVEVRTPYFDSEKKKTHSQPYHKVNCLVDGADEFLSLGCGGAGNPKMSVPVGRYDMTISHRTFEKDGKKMFFTDLISLSVLSPVK